ncbi:hypothetical protein F5Y00DRAFT_121081 [Daldinia vernicosa]|uniref:uncharacterized protein n=1 Tax=Daldinia vernicosa TaxID=114800 RepID=UPI0020078A27|nr:uncharacterized protein F5Y00DRAFT_121081 [Daldinia vernicosa]KAI0847335.1 hypothetical protein F5Y00DRAFT_121081 [Daldinia vernicosa]
MPRRAYLVHRLERAYRGRGWGGKTNRSRSVRDDLTSLLALSFSSWYGIYLPLWVYYSDIAIAIITHRYYNILTIAEHMPMRRSADSLRLNRGPCIIPLVDAAKRLRKDWGGFSWVFPSQGSKMTRMTNYRCSIRAVRGIYVDGNPLYHIRIGRSDVG